MIKPQKSNNNLVKENQKKNLKLFVFLFIILLSLFSVNNNRYSVSGMENDNNDISHIFASSITNITLPEPNFDYNNDTNYLSIPEFAVTFTNDTGTFLLNETEAVFAKFYLVYRQINDDVELDPIISTYAFNLTHSNGKWSFPSTFITGLAANTNHSLVYFFKMSNSENTWSNISSERFYINLFPIDITGLSITYDWNTRLLDVEDVLVTCPTYSDIGIVNDSNTNLAKWIMYMRAVGGEVMVPVIDTQGTYMTGNLSYNDLTDTWFSLNNDIGWVFTPSNVEYVVVVRFNLTDLPSGFFKPPYGFIPYVQAVSATAFLTRPHVITVSKPSIVYDEQAKTISVFNVTAYTDHHNIVLDYYQMIEKDIFGEDTRIRIIYICPPHDTGWGEEIESAGPLLWNETMQWWYKNDIDVSHLHGGEYWMCAKFANEVTNYTTAELGPPSEVFVIGGREVNSISFIFAFTTILIATITLNRIKNKKKNKNTS